MASGKVISGDYSGKGVIASFGTISVVIGWGKSFDLTPATVAKYELIPCRHQNTYQVSVGFKDGKKSLLQLDRKAYDIFIKNCFSVNNSATASVEQTDTPEAAEPTPVPQLPPTPKKASGCLISFIVFIVVIIIIISSNSGDKQQQNVDETASNVVETAANVVIDAMSFWVDASQEIAISDEELIERLGEPESVDEWNYINSETKVPIKTLYYDDNTYAYHFNSGVLQRIKIEDVEIPYANKKEIPSLFGLNGYANAKVVADTGVAYRVENCGVRQLWVQIMDKNNLKTIAIDYGTAFIDGASESKSDAKTETMGQKNALKQAKSYLDLSAFSHDGLIEQLEYEGYSTEDATYAADNCGADWREQSVKAAESYLDLSAFSRSGLIEQLMYEGFSKEDAEYGVTQNGY